ncbi:MAG: D-sedoheptulose 7-phosphate isomerase [Shewanella sp.]
MENMKYITDYINNSISVKNTILSDEKLLANISRVADLCISAIRKGKRVFFAGNGGSAADAQHLAAEFVSRFNYDRPGMAGIALTTDTSIITAIGNDYGYEHLFERQIQALGNEGDVFIGLTTSGNSLNILRAISAAKKQGIVTVGLCGAKGDIYSLADYTIGVPSVITPNIQESHIMIGHIICAIVEKEIHPRGV